MLHLIALYAGLIDPRWEARESAESQLVSLIERHPDIYGQRLAELAREATEPEVRARCRRPLLVYARWRVASYVPRSVPVWPICDAFPVANPVVPFGMLDVRCKCSWPVEHCSTARSGGPHWTAYRQTTERRIRALIGEGMSHADADMLLERMYAIEVRAKCDCNFTPDWTGWRGGYVTGYNWPHKSAEMSP